MSPISEIDAIKTIDDALSELQDPAVRDRVLQWAWDKFASKEKFQMHQVDMKPLKKEAKQTRKPKSAKKSKNASKSNSGPTIIKELNLNPSGKQSFKSFAEDKLPSANNEKCVVSVYYLLNELELDNISVNHIFTCYKNVGWRVPANLYNIVAVTASRNGWLDTSDMNNIKLTPHGGNLVEFDLPKKSKEN